MNYTNILPQTSPSAHSPVKRNPEDIARQLQINQKRRPLLESQKTVEHYKNENLALKLKLHQMNKLLADRSIHQDSLEHEETKRDLIDDLMTRNEELKKQLEERDRTSKREEIREKSRHRERGCQTNLDSMNIDELLAASITLKRQREQQKQFKPNQRHQATQYTSDVPSSIHKQKHDQAQHQIVTQLHYPNVTIAKQVSSSKSQLLPDEKELLETLYRVDGVMTTALDKLRAVSNDH